MIRFLRKELSNRLQLSSFLFCTLLLVASSSCKKDSATDAASDKAQKLAAAPSGTQKVSVDGTLDLNT